MRDWIQQFGRAFTDKECDKIIKIGQSCGPQKAVVGHGGKSRVDTSIRVSETAWVSRWHTEMLPFYERIRLMAGRANMEAFGLDIDDFYEVQFTVYKDTEEGRYGAHMDSNWIQGKEDTREYERKLSWVLMLSDPTEVRGGKFKLSMGHQDWLLKNRGDLLFFPSHVIHEVTPVIMGTRLTLVSWIVGPRIR